MSLILDSLKSWYGTFTVLPDRYTVPDETLWLERSAKALEEAKEVRDEVDHYTTVHYSGDFCEEDRTQAAVWLIKELCDSVIAMLGLLMLLGVPLRLVLWRVVTNNMDRTSHSGMVGSKYAHDSEAKKEFKQAIEKEIRCAIGK